MNIHRQHWVRFENAGVTGFGTLADGRIAVHRGDMFSSSEPTGESVALESVRLLMPTEQGHRAVEQLRRAGCQAQSRGACGAAVSAQSAEFVREPG